MPMRIVRALLFGALAASLAAGCAQGAADSSSAGGPTIAPSEWPLDPDFTDTAAAVAADGRKVSLDVVIMRRFPKDGSLLASGGFDRDRLVQGKCCKYERAVFLTGDAAMALNGDIDLRHRVLARVQGTYRSELSEIGRVRNTIEVDQLDVIERFSPSPKPKRSKKPKEKFNRLDPEWWSHIARDPNVYAGTKVITYAVVVQQDAKTGGDMFLAAASSSPIWDVSAGDLTIYSGKAVTVDPGDRLRIKGVVLGHQTYSNKAGGSNTVPSIEIASVQRLN